MNKIYKLVWFKAKNCYMVTSELVKFKSKVTKNIFLSKTLILGILACVISSGISLPSYAVDLIDSTSQVDQTIQDALDTKVNVSDFNNSMDLKADKNSVYSKDETDTLLGNKADKANTLKGYGIEDAYTKEDIDTLLNKKADKTALDEVKAITESNQKTLAELTDVNELIEETENIKKRIDDMEIIVGSDAVLMTTNNSDIITASTDSIEIGSDARYDDLNSISIAKSDGSGRVLRGVITDPEDNNSAANVGYVNAIGEGIIAGVNGKFAKVDDKINKVGAGAAAMASLTPANYDGDEKWTLSASVGNYRDATAGAIGLFYRPSDKVMVNVRGTIGNEENMVGGGVAVALDKGTAPGITKIQMVKTINAQAEEIQSIKAEREADKQHIAQQDKEIAELKAIVQKLVKDNNILK